MELKNVCVLYFGSIQWHNIELMEYIDISCVCLYNVYIASGVIYFLCIQNVFTKMLAVSWSLDVIWWSFEIARVV